MALCGEPPVLEVGDAGNAIRYYIPTNLIGIFR